MNSRDEIEIKPDSITQVNKHLSNELSELCHFLRNTRDIIFGSLSYVDRVTKNLDIQIADLSNHNNKLFCSNVIIKLFDTLNRKSRELKATLNNAELSDNYKIIKMKDLLVEFAKSLEICYANNIPKVHVASTLSRFVGVRIVTLTAIILDFQMHTLPSMDYKIAKHAEWIPRPIDHYLNSSILAHQNLREGKLVDQANDVETKVDDNYKKELEEKVKERIDSVPKEMEALKKKLKDAKDKKKQLQNTIHSLKSTLTDKDLLIQSCIVRDNHNKNRFILFHNHQSQSSVNDQQMLQPPLNPIVNVEQKSEHLSFSS
jgi:hypothetical protein